MPTPLLTRRGFLIPGETIGCRPWQLIYIVKWHRTVWPAWQLCMSMGFFRLLLMPYQRGQSVRVLKTVPEERRCQRVPCGMGKNRSLRAVFLYKKEKGAGGNRTHEYQFCRLTPYHLATAPYTSNCYYLIIIAKKHNFRKSRFGP